VIRYPDRQKNTVTPTKPSMSGLVGACWPRTSRMATPRTPSNPGWWPRSRTSVSRTGRRYDIAVLDRDIPGPTGDEIAARIVASDSGMPILMLTAADRASHELRTPVAVTQTLLDVARMDPGRDTGDLLDRLTVVNTPAIDLTEALLLLSRADQRSFAREPVDLSLVAEEATETLVALAEKGGITVETSGEVAPTVGSHALLLQMATNLLHNAIVHNRSDQGSVRVTTGVQPTSVLLTVEHRRRAQPAPRLHAGRAVPARPRPRPRRPLGGRPGSGDRRADRPRARRHAHPGAPPGRWALRHGTYAGCATAGRSHLRTDQRPPARLSRCCP
jgi:CheY-like chemotaxis protein